MRGRGVGARLAGLLVLFSGVVTLVVTATQVAFEYRREMEGVHRELADVEQSSAVAVATTVWVRDREMTQALIDGIVRRQDIERVEVLDEDGLYAAAGLRSSSEVVERVFPLQYMHTDGPRRLGRIRVIAGLDALYERLGWHILEVLASQAFVIFFVAGFLLLLVHALVTRHLAFIAAALRNSDIRAGHVRLALPRPASRGDEFDEVVDAMNRAGEQVHDAYAKLASELALRESAEEELRKAQRDMERRIFERTAELAATNGELFAEIRRREQAEQALRESEARARALLDCSVLEAALINAAGDICGANKAFARRVGVPEGKLDGCRLDELLPTATANRLSSNVRRVIETGRATEFEHEEGDRAFTVHVAPIPGETVRETLAAVFCRDITLERHAEQLREDVERMTRHDLKSPIIGILSGIQSLRLGAKLSRESLGTLRDMEDSGYLALDMINRSLDLYKMEKGLYELRPEPVMVATIVEDSIRALHELAARRNVMISGRCVDIARPACVTIIGERTLCFSMMANLIKNAIEASPAGSAVTVGCGQDQGMATITIHNRGTVPPDIRGRMFEKYVSSGKRGGTGLGTYSARLIARTHGGDIDVATSEESGTTVTVRLPAAPAE